MRLHRRRRCGTVASSTRRAPSPRRCERRPSAAPPAARRSRARPPRARSARESSARRDRARPAGAGRAARRSRPSARSSWRRRSAPKRAASGARGRSSDVADALEADARQRRRRSRPAAAVPRAAAARAASRSCTGWRRSAVSPKRAAAQAAPMVPAMAARAVKPERASCAPARSSRSFCFAAEQMRAAADVEQDAVGRIDGDERRVAQAPVGDGVEQAASAAASSGTAMSAGCMARACASARPACRPSRSAVGIDRDEQIEIAALAEDDARRGTEPSSHATAARCGRSRAARARGSECADARSKRCSILFHSTIQVRDDRGDCAQPRGEAWRTDAMR